MDRNVVIATVLIAVIMFGWLWMLAPSPDELSGTADPTVDTVAVAQQQQAVAEALAEERAAEAAPAPVDSTIAGAFEGEARVITVETDLYTARFSTKGATLVSFLLKTYNQFDQQTPVQLVSDSLSGALWMEFTTPTSHNVATKDFYFEPSTDQDVLRFDEQAGTLTFTAQVGGGTIRQTYTFTPDEYEVGLKIDQDNAGAFATDEGYELVWNGGLPFSEGDPEKESENAGAYASSGGEVEEITLGGEAYQEERLNGSVAWTALKTKYFTAVMIPDAPTRGAELTGETINGETPIWENYSMRLMMPAASADGDSYRLYLGPMEFYRITDYDLGLYGIVDYGWMGWMTRPLAKFIFIPFFTFLSSFIPNYGVVIILFAIILKLVLYPLTKTSYKSMARMKELQPKMEAIKEKHGDNPQKQQEAMMKLYRDTGVNPVGGCVPMLLQYPIIIALWLFLPQSIEIRQQGFLWAHDLSAPDVILNLPFMIPLYGDFVAGFTLLMGLSMVVQMKIQMGGQSNAQTKIFTYVFPVMIFAIFNRLAAGLSLYYLTYNVVTAIQQKYINSHLEKSKDDPVGSNGKASTKVGGRARRAPRKAKKSR